jgi:hypothetical protein
MERALRFADAVVVEVAGPKEPGEPVAGAAAVSKKFSEVTAGIDQVVKPIVENLTKAIAEQVESVEVELKFSFTAEGSLFLCKASGDASICVKARIRGGAAPAQP